MPSRKPSSPVLDTSEDDVTVGDATGDAVELAEAEAAEAEAVAAAARARARAIRLRREADAQREAGEADSEAEDVDESDADALDIDEATATVGAEASGNTVAAPADRTTRGGQVAKFVAAGVVGVLIVALLAVSGFMFWQHRNAVAEQRSAAEYAAAARQGVVALMSLDYNRAQEDVQRIIDNSTGQFKEDFEATAEDFVKVAQSSKAVTETTVNATAVDSMTDDSAVVLVAATSRVTNEAGANQDPRNWRLSVTMNRDGDQIKMSKVEFVP